MDSLPSPSQIPIDVTITSELEPLKSSGYFEERPDGFVMEFSVGDGSYRITHTAASTRLETTGLVCYAIDFNDAVTDTSLKTPFGELGFSVLPKRRTVTVTADGVDVELKYSLIAADIAEERSVTLSARFSN